MNCSKPFMDHKGFTLAVSNERGGKAGRGRAKTGTIQVREPWSKNGYLLRHSVRYQLGDIASMRKAVESAITWIDKSALRKAKGLNEA